MKAARRVLIYVVGVLARSAGVPLSDCLVYVRSCSVDAEKDG